MNRHKLRGLVVSIAICHVVSTGGAVLTATSVGTWYPTLVKPAWNPPNAVFGPVWTTLFVMMAVAAWLVWRQVGIAGARRALTFYAIQLGLNLAWSAFFFGLRRPDLALIDIVLLWVAIAVTAAEFRRHSATAALLLIPYFLWVGYAFSLNAAIWYLNG